MIDLDHKICFSCPDECGQLAVSCTLRMILSNEVFSCDCCGCEFQGNDFPQWLSHAVCIANGKEQTALRDMMIAVYAYLYADGPCPNDNMMSQLLENNLDLWTLFPRDKIPSSLLLPLLGDAAFVAAFDFGSLTNAKMVEILSRRPELISKCPLEKLAGNDWLVLLAARPEFVSLCPEEMLLSIVRDHSDLASIPPEKVEILFNHCPFKNDFRFVRTSTAEPAGKSASPGLFDSEDIFFTFVNFFRLGKYVDWGKFSPSAQLQIFKKYPFILTSYPFTDKKLTDFDWTSYSNSDWQQLTAKITLPAVLRPVCELRTGKKIAENLKQHPELERFCNWDAMSSAEWTDLLITLPSGCWRSCKWNVIEESDWNKIIKDGRNDYAITVHQVINGKEIAQALNKYPAVEKYINWDSISAVEWLGLVESHPKYAGNLPWLKIYDYIARLPEKDRQSGNNKFPGLWEKKDEMLDYVNVPELYKLPADKYYTVLDFFDWEDSFDFSKMTSAARIDLFSKHPQFGEKYGWNKLSSEEKVLLANRSRSFCMSYGWDNFTEDETLKILQRHPEYFGRFNSARFSRSFWRKMIDLDEKYDRYYKLDLFDYLLFRKIKSAKLCCKITFVWHFIFCLAAFAGFGYFMYDGPCGFQALWQESRLRAVYSASVYGGIAILWSCFHAWLYSGRTPFILTFVSGILGGLLAALQFGYTFFLARITVLNYICWGILAVTVFILMCVKASEGELFTSNRSGLKAMFFLYFPLLIATAAICHPVTHSQFLTVYEQIDKSPRPFRSAANYYLSKAFDTDAATREIITKLKTKLETNDYDEIEALYAKIPSRYSDIPEVIGLAEPMKNVSLQKKKKYTEAAIKAYRRNDIRYLNFLLRQADTDNAEIQFIQGKCFDLGLADHNTDTAEAVKWYRKAAEQGHARAQNNLGFCYSIGRGVARDTAEAVKWYRKAAAQGLAIAQNNLGCCCRDGKGTAQDSAEAFKWFLSAASQGFAAAQNNLGVCYRDGKGVVPNSAEAMKWFRKAAEQGHSVAQYNLGAFYEFGQGVKQDYAEALKWYRKAAARNSSDGQFKLGYFYDKGLATEKNAYEAVKWYRKAADRGDAQAQFNLGVCYENGQGVDKNMYEAFKWYRKAAAQGHASAQFNLGWCYAKGQGVDKELHEAVKWYRKAADQGQASAQNNLGWCYMNGQGVDQDLREGVKWYRKAAAQGNACSQYNLGGCYENGQGVDKELDEAAKWYRKAAERGYAPAQNDLGVCYYMGKGVVKNFSEAAKWFRKSADQGNAWAQNNLGICYLNGRGVRKNKNEAQKWFRKAAGQGHEGARKTLDEMARLEDSEWW